MLTGIIGRKVGMTQLFDDDGTVHPATVIKAGPCVVVQAKTAQVDGYEAVQLGLVEETPAKTNKPTKGHFKRANVPATRVRREVRIAPDPTGAGGAGGAGSSAPPAGPATAGNVSSVGTGQLKPGDQVLVSIFSRGERVDIIGTGRGKGFQGVVRRHHFGGGAATHGSMFHRAPGSIGASSFPSRVVKGMRAAGRMGGGRVTIRNLKVLRVDAENHLLIVEGSVPGAPESYVMVRKALKAKRIKVAQVEKPKKGKK